VPFVRPPPEFAESRGEAELQGTEIVLTVAAARVLMARAEREGRSMTAAEAVREVLKAKSDSRQ
jgi:hypothetical protein